MKRARGLALAAAVLTAAPFVATSIPTTLPAHAAPTSPFITETDVEGAVLTITDLGDGLLAPAEDLSVSYTIVNNSAEPLELSRIQLRSQGYTPTIARQVESWMNDSMESFLLKGEAVEKTIAPGEKLSGTLTVERKNLAWRSSFTDWGPRGIEVRAITTAGERISDRSMVVVESADELTPMAFSAIVPVTMDSRELNDSRTFLDLLTDAEHFSDTPQGESAEPSEAEELAPEDTATAAETNTDALNADYRSDETDNALRGWNIRGVSLFVDPAILVDETIVDPLRDPSAELHLLPYDDVDISALAHTSNTEILHQKIEASRKLAEDWGLDANADIFIPAGSVDQDTLNAVSAAGMVGAVVSESDAPLWNSTFYTQSARTELEIGEETIPAAVPNDLLSTVIAGNLPTSNEPLTLDDLDRQQVALSLSALTYRQLPNAPRPTVVKISRDQIYSADADAARETVKALTRAPWLSAEGVSTILTEVPESLYATAQRQSPAQTVVNPGELTTTDMRALANSLEHVKTFASIFDNSDFISESAKAYADGLLSVGWRSFPNFRERQIRQLAPDPDVQSAIRVESSSTINMISESSELPIHVTNPFDFPVNVNVNLKTQDSRLRAPEAVSVRLPAGQTTQVPLPVEAWGSGNLRVKATVTNEAGETIGQSQDLAVRVRADWENWGTAIIAGLFAVVLVVGVARSIRKGRRTVPIDADDFSAAVNATKSNS